MQINPLKTFALILLTLLCLLAIIIFIHPNKLNKRIVSKTIITSFYPICISTLNITQGVDDVEVINLTKPQTGCLHDYSLTPVDMEKLQTADIFVINGAKMESFMDKVIAELPNIKIINSSKGLKPIYNKSNNEPNPHFWLSISDNIKQVENIASQLSLLDKKNAKKYQKNAEIYIDKLKTLNIQMHTELSNLKNRNIITFHEAFPYFAKEFNLNIVSVIEREPGSEPSAKQLKETIDIIKKHNVKALFAEPQYPAKAAETIAKETGIDIYYLDPAVTGDINPNAYLNIMQQNLKILKKALL